MHGLPCSVAYGIFPDQGSNSGLLLWQADSLLLSCQGSPEQTVQSHKKAQMTQVFLFLFLMVILHVARKSVIMKRLGRANESFGLIWHLFYNLTCHFGRISDYRKSDFKTICSVKRQFPNNGETSSIPRIVKSFPQWEWECLLLVLSAPWQGAMHSGSLDPSFQSSVKWINWAGWVPKALLGCRIKWF